MRDGIEGKVYILHFYNDCTRINHVYILDNKINRRGSGLFYSSIILRKGISIGSIPRYGVPLPL